jgi:hypothetical protein
LTIISGAGVARVHMQNQYGLYQQVPTGPGGQAPAANGNANGNPPAETEGQ